MLKPLICCFCIFIEDKSLLESPFIAIALTKSTSKDYSENLLLCL